MSGAWDSSDFDGNNILVGSVDNEYVFTSGFEVINFNTKDKFAEFKSLMGNNLISKAIAIEEKTQIPNLTITISLKTKKSRKEF